MGHSKSLDMINFKNQTSQNLEVSMLEGIAMSVALLGMGIYFVKSTDLPKDMKERSAQFRASSPELSSTSTTKKYSFPKVVDASEKVKSDIDAKLAEAKKRERQLLVELHNKKIDEITLLITTLEQQIKDNTALNIIIQKQINAHLETLRVLQETKIA